MTLEDGVFSLELNLSSQKESTATLFRKLRNCLEEYVGLEPHVNTILCSWVSVPVIVEEVGK